MWRLSLEYTSFLDATCLTTLNPINRSSLSEIVKLIFAERILLSANFF